MSIAELQLRLLDESVANMLIMLVRMITSAEVRSRLRLRRHGPCGVSQK